MDEVIKTAKDIVIEQCSKAEGGCMLPGQMKWILEAMWEYAKQEKDMAYEMGYKDGARDEHKTAMEEIAKYQERISNFYSHR